jgi:phenylacetate-CoA ligase
MDSYGELFRRVLFPTWENQVRHRPTVALWERVERSQWLGTPALRAQQLESLRELLAHASQHVPHYRDSFRSAGFQPGDLRVLEDLTRLPVLTRDIARDAGERRISTAPPFPTIRKNSSGTTGKPLSFAYDPRSEHWRQAIKLRGYGWAGCFPGTRTFHYWGVLPQPDPVPRSREWKIAVERKLRREIYVDCGRRSEADLSAAVRTFAAHRPTVMVCYSLAGGDLARYVLDQRLRTWPDVNVIAAGEPLHDRDREAMQRAFGPVYNTYGCREVMLIGTECDHHQGLHVSMENLVIEIVVTDGDGESRPARPGETGEVLITDLHNFGMPFIRYRNGDLATASTDEPWPAVAACRASPPSRDVSPRRWWTAAARASAG